MIHHAPRQGNFFTGHIACRTIDLWLKEAAPSTSLRKWFNHDPEKWKEFQRRYHAELKLNSAALQPLLEAVRKGRVTLIYGAKDEQHNDAVALKSWLETA